MKKRTANKIFNVILEYQQFQRWDMPYTGSQIRRAAKILLPPRFRARYRYWHKETEAEGKASFEKHLQETLNRHKAKHNDPD